MGDGYESAQMDFIGGMDFIPDYDKLLWRGGELWIFLWRHFGAGNFVDLSSLCIFQI